MFADPTSIAIGATVSSTGGTATSFPRIRTDGYSSEYRTADGANDFAIKHQLGTRYRSEVRLNKNATYTDPSTGLIVPVVATAYLVVNRPAAGFTSADLKGIINGLLAHCCTSANQDKILAFES